jgi:hypothetical protein
MAALLTRLLAIRPRQTAFRTKAPVIAVVVAVQARRARIASPAHFVRSACCFHSRHGRSASLSVVFVAASASRAAQEFRLAAHGRRLGFHARVQFGADRAVHHVFQPGPHRDRAVPAQKRHRVLPERLRQRLPQCIAPNQHVGAVTARASYVEHRHIAAEERGDMVHRLQRYLRVGERDYCLRTAVHDGSHVRPHPVDFSVDVALDVRGAAVWVDRLAIAVVLDDLCGTDQSCAMLRAIRDDLGSLSCRTLT